MKRRNLSAHPFSEPVMAATESRSGFFWKNLLKGIGFLLLIIALYVLAQRYIDIDSYMAKLGEWPVLMYLTFCVSEIVFGIIPPELFIIWVMDHGVFQLLAADVLLLAFISYGAGMIGYSLGRASRSWDFMQPVMQHYVFRYDEYFRKYGGFLVVVAALTPLPFSAICMLMGASRYPYLRFLVLALVRFIRFAIYGWAIWKTIAV